MIEERSDLITMDRAETDKVVQPLETPWSLEILNQTQETEVLLREQPLQDRRDHKHRRDKDQLRNVRHLQEENNPLLHDQMMVVAEPDQKDLTIVLSHLLPDQVALQVQVLVAAEAAVVHHQALQVHQEGPAEDDNLEFRFLK